MIDLYAAATSNGMRARMALEECGLAYALHPIALDKGEHRTPQFLAPPSWSIAPKNAASTSPGKARHAPPCGRH